MKRATRQTDPIQPDYRADIDRVIADMLVLVATVDNKLAKVDETTHGTQFSIGGRLKTYRKALKEAKRGDRFNFAVGAV